MLSVCEVKVEVTSRLTVSQSVSQSVCLRVETTLGLTSCRKCINNELLCLSAHISASIAIVSGLVRITKELNRSGSGFPSNATLV
jgi:hypothetical protein